MKVMETNTAAIYLRKSTEGDVKSVAAQELQIRRIQSTCFRPMFRFAEDLRRWRRCETRRPACVLVGNRTGEVRIGEIRTT